MKNIQVSPNGNIRSRLVRPETENVFNEIYVKGSGWYRWNAVYRTYNGLDTNDLLAFKQYTKIDWQVTEDGLTKFLTKSDA